MPLNSKELLKDLNFASHAVLPQYKKKKVVSVAVDMQDSVI